MSTYNLTGSVVPLTKQLFDAFELLEVSAPLDAPDSLAAGGCVDTWEVQQYVLREGVL